MPASTALLASSMTTWNDAGLYVSRPADRSSRCDCCCCCAQGGFALLCATACRRQQGLLLLLCRGAMLLHRPTSLLCKNAGLLLLQMNHVLPGHCMQ